MSMGLWRFEKEWPPLTHVYECVAHKEQHCEEVWPIGVGMASLEECVTVKADFKVSHMLKLDLA